jgi:adenosylcobinamide amidohydrolase
MGHDNEKIGTPTDSIAILCPKEGSQPLRYAGLGMKIGAEIVDTVQATLLKALSFRYQTFVESYLASQASPIFA